MTSYHGPLSEVSWSHAPGQVESGRELILMPSILNYEIYQGSELATTFPVLLSAGTVHLPHNQPASAMGTDSSKVKAFSNYPPLYCVGCGELWLEKWKTNEKGERLVKLIHTEKNL